MNRSYSTHFEFKLYIGNMLSCISPSSGIITNKFNYKLRYIFYSYIIIIIICKFIIYQIATYSGSIFKYYGGDIDILGTSGYINSSSYSMAIGGTRTPYDNNTYSMNILQKIYNLIHIMD